jgi:hypothetical protein
MNLTIETIENLKKGYSKRLSKQDITDWLAGGSISVKHRSTTSEWKTLEEPMQSILEELSFDNSVAEDIATQYLESRQSELSRESLTKQLDIQQPQLDINLEKRFNELASKWQHETGGLSSITKKITNFNYLKIIAMGKAVVPLILRSLAKQPDHWFVALKALTDQDPTSPNSSFEQAVEAWLSWGRQEGLID